MGEACLQFSFPFTGMYDPRLRPHSSDPVYDYIMSSIKAFKFHYYMPGCLLPCLLAVIRVSVKPCILEKLEFDLD